MRGYRTLIVNALMVAFGLAGTTISPELATQYADLFIMLWGVINVLLRKITTGPMFATTTPPTTGSAGDSGGTVVKAIGALLIVGALGLPLGGCAIPVAETPAQKVFALQSDLETAQEAALAVVTAPGVPAPVKAAIKDAEAVAVVAVLAAQNAVRTGGDTPVLALIDAAQDAIDALARRVTGGAS